MGAPWPPKPRRWRDVTFRDRSRWRMRRVRVSRTWCVRSGTSRSRTWKLRRWMTSRRTSVSARTVAERGSPSSRLISPKKSPGLSRLRLRGETSTLAEPSTMMKKASPGSPVRVSTVPAGSSTTLEMAATARSCLRVSPANMGTSSSRRIFSSWLTR